MRVFLYLCISCLSLCNCICISGVFASFSGFTCCSLSSSPHQPAFTGKVYRSALTVCRSLYKWAFPKIEGRPSIFGNHQRVEKMSFFRPKKAIMRPKKKAFSRNHIARYFLQKTASKLVKFGLCSSISDLHGPIWGHHPMLYFPSQIQRNIVLCYARCGQATQQT